MNRILIAVLFLMSLATGAAAQKLMAEPDKSPLDASYYPADFPLMNLQRKVNEPLRARVFYSRPQKNNRQIFGSLIPYKKVWRLGANEATEIEFFTNVLFNNVKVKKGRYTLYAIPDSTSWTVILNKELNTWGSFAYDQAKDVARTSIPVIPLTEPAEFFTLYFDKAATGYALNAVWDNCKIILPITLQ